MQTPEEVIAGTQVEFLHGVPVSVRQAGAERIINELWDAGYKIVPDVERLAFHHIDGNPRNNDPKNLRVVLLKENRK